MVVRIVVFLSVLLGGLAVSGCDGSGNAPVTAGQPAESAINQGAEQARAGLLERDLAFGNAVAELGLAEAYRQFLAEDAVQLPDGDWPVQGRDAIYAQIRDATRNPGPDSTQESDPQNDFALSWKPSAAEVSVSGDLGYTWGAFWLEVLDEAGDPVVIEGNYVNVWRKSAEGVWEVIVDISNQISADYLVTEEPDSNDQGADPAIE